MDHSLVAILVKFQFFFCLEAVVLSNFFNKGGDIKMFYQDTDVIKQYTAVSDTECAVSCASYEYCVSANYDETDGECRLLGSNQWKFPAQNYQTLSHHLEPIGGN